MPGQASSPQFYIDSEKPHLGGYIVGGDDATYYPDLWRWLVEERDVRSVIDIGCGEGHAARWFVEHGVNFVYCVDGVDQPQLTAGVRSFVRHDYTTGPYIPQPQFELAWCCEFVEHIEEQYIPNFLATFRCADLVLMTHAEPGQMGHHHVNTQTPMYWQGVMAAIGYELDAGTTDDARHFAAKNSNPYNHFARSGLAFVKRPRWPDDFKNFGTNVRPKKQR